MMQYPSRMTVQLHDTTPPPLPESRTDSVSEEELEDSSVVEDESQGEQEARLATAEVNERLSAALVE